MQTIESTGVYTITSNENKGQDNLGHSIPELLNEPNVYLVTSPSTVQPKNSVNTNNSTPHSINNKLTSKMTPIPRRPRLGRKTSRVIDIFIALAIGTWLILIELGLIPHYKRGFFCDDRSITMKSRGDTVSASLIISSISFPFFIIWLVEAILYKPRTLKSTRLKQTLFQSWFWYKDFLIGILVKLFIVEAMKISIGELRPHFLQTCQPDAAVNCTGGEYISEYSCTNNWDSKMYVRDSSKSFPSGHSSVSVYEAVFLIWYLQSTVPKIHSKLLIPLTQGIFLVWASYVSLSRITDHRHHWWDVLVGAKLGVLFAVLTCVFLCKNFKRRRTQEMIVENGNSDRNHTSVRRLLSDTSCKDDVTMNNVVMP